MVALLADAGTTELLISLAGGGGLLMAVIAWLKLPSDKQSAAVGQAQGANEVLQETLEAVERERDYWKQRYEACAAQLTRIVNELGLQDRLND